MPRLQENINHDAETQRSHYRYQFTTKHHGGAGSAGEAQWQPSLELADEFAIFELADTHEIADLRGNLYGIHRLAGGALADVGTWQQQIAKFPVARPGEPWHGYPLFPIGKAGPEELRGGRCEPEKSVFATLERTGLITKRQRKRLQKGDHA